MTDSLPILSNSEHPSVKPLSHVYQFKQRSIFDMNVRKSMKNLQKNEDDETQLTLVTRVLELMQYSAAGMQGYTMDSIFVECKYQRLEGCDRYEV